MLAEQQLCFAPTNVPQPLQNIRNDRFLIRCHPGQPRTRSIGPKLSVAVLGRSSLLEIPQNKRLNRSLPGAIQPSEIRTDNEMGGDLCPYASFVNSVYSAASEWMLQQCLNRRT